MQINARNVVAVFSLRLLIELNIESFSFINDCVLKRLWSLIGKLGKSYKCFFLTRRAHHLCYRLRHQISPQEALFMFHSSCATTYYHCRCSSNSSSIEGHHLFQVKSTESSLQEPRLLSQRWGLAPDLRHWQTMATTVRPCCLDDQAYHQINWQHLSGQSLRQELLHLRSPTIQSGTDLRGNWMDYTTNLWKKMERSANWDSNYNSWIIG